MRERLIPRDKSIIVACDVSEIEKLRTLVDKTCLIEGIGGYKVGLELVISHGLPKVVGIIRELTDLPIIYDHQKGGIDIPELGRKFAKVCRKAGVDAIILFPFGGAESERAWISACQDEDLFVLVGAHMTQGEFFEKEGGFIANSAPERIFVIAVEEGVRDFVVPGNKVEYVKLYKGLLERILGKDNFTLYAPGFINQGGSISEAGKVAGKKWHAIVGSAIYKAEDIQNTAKTMVKEILNDEVERLPLELFDIGAIKFGKFKLKLHEIHPEAPLSPFYVDLRTVRSHPEVMEDIVRVYGRLLKDIKFDLLADVPTASTPIVGALSLQLKVPMVSPRIDQKTHGTGGKIEGTFKEGQIVVLIDDLVTKADSKIQAIKILEENGLQVYDVVVLVDREQGGREKLEKKGYHLWSVFEISTLFEIYLKAGRITKDQYREAVNYLKKESNVR